MARRTGWAIALVAGLLMTGQTVMLAQHVTLFSGEALLHAAWPAVPAAALGSAVMGALVLSRLPRHPIGWLLSASGLVTSLSMFFGEYGDWVLQDGGPGPLALARASAWLGALTGASMTFTLVAVIFLLAPDGRLPSRRWRPALWTAVGGATAYTAAVLTFDPRRIPADGSDPEFATVTEVLAVIGTLLNAVGLVAAAASLVLRLRKTRGVERQQLRWMAVAAVGLAFGVIVLVTAQLLGVDPALSAVPLYLAYFALPICTAIAVLRYRLFDLDLIINRALVLALATAVVAVGYVAAVTLIGSAIGGGAGGIWPSLLATAVVALAFQPVRRRVVRLADRLAYGRSAAPYEALADFSRRLGESPDPTSLLPGLAEAAATAVGARTASVRLSVPGAPDQQASWPASRANPSGPVTEVEVADGDERLGVIAVVMPPGRAMRPRERQLLSDLADQAAIAFRNARLTAELAARVDQLDRQTLDLIQSRRRLVMAGDAERLRLERAIGRDVVPHLRPLPERLAALAASADVGAAQLRPHITAATEALEALREITRGVFPAQLARSGVEPALASHLDRNGTGRLVVEGSAAGRRFDPRVEAAAYFCVVEVTRELSAPLEVRLAADNELVQVVVTGLDGTGLALSALRDRAEALDGTVTREVVEGRTVVRVTLPTRAASAAGPAAAVAAGSGGAGP